MYRLTAVVAAMAAWAALAGPVEFQNDFAWGDLKVVTQKNGSVVVKTPDGKRVCSVEARPNAAKLNALLKVSAAADGLDLDLRAAFAAGARVVWLRSGDFAVEKFRDTDVEFVAELSGGEGGDFAKAEVLGEGRCGESGLSLRGKKNKVITTRARPVCPGRRRYSLASIVPGDATELRAVVEFSAAGAAPVRFHGFAVGHVGDLPGCAAARPAGEPELLFHLPFDGSLAAAVAKGKGRPLVTNALRFVEGRRGQALRCDRSAASRLVYSAKGNVDPSRGTMTCWFLHDLPVDKTQSLFTLFAGRESGPGDGALRLEWTGYSTLGILRWERGDYERSKRSWGPSVRPLPTNGWVQLTLTWDERRVKVYANGVPVPKGRISDNTCPLNDLLFEPPEMMFAEGWRERLSLIAVGCGTNKANCWNGAIDDLKIWSEPFTPEKAEAFYAAETGRPAGPRPMWDEPWREPPTPLPPNRASRPPTDVPGVPTGMELVEEVFPAELARKNDAGRFRVTGKWTVGTCDGLEYLEAGKGLNDRFAVRFRLDGTVPLWCFEITYPDDKARAIDLVVQNSARGDGYSLNSGIETGLEHPLTGKNAVKKFLYWRGELFPDAERNGDLALVAMTQTEENPAAISRIRVYAIRDGRIPETRLNDAPPVNGMKRRSAIWFEDPAIMNDFGTLNGQGEDTDPRLLIDRIAAYMKYTGQDTLVYPAVWYAGIIGDYYMPRRHMSHFMREVCRRFERDGLAFVPSINQQWFPQFDLKLERRMLTDGSLHATPISILDTGLPNMGGWHHSPTYYNISHPDVQNALLREIELVCGECREHPNFIGLAIDPFNAINVTSWGMITAGYNDYSIDAFEKATGIKVPVDRKDPMRGRAYAAWLKANAFDPWVQWRCDVLTDFYRRAAETLRRARPDLTLFIRCSIIWRTQLEKREDLFRDDFPNRILRESGIDCATLSRLPGVSLALSSMPAFWHDELHKIKAPKETLERIRDLPETEGYQDLILDSAYPFADFHESYYETSVGAKNLTGHHSGDGRLSGDWFQEKPWRVTHFAASGREALRPYAKALKTGDVFAFGRGGFLLGTCGDEAVTAPFMRTFRSLPAVKFADVAGFKHPDVRLRTAKALGKTWHYAVNTGFDPVEIAPGLPAGAKDAVTGEAAPAKLKLDSYEIRAFVTE